jgi:hypothetical protein
VNQKVTCECDFTGAATFANTIAMSRTGGDRGGIGNREIGQYGLGRAPTGPSTATTRKTIKRTGPKVNWLYNFQHKNLGDYDDLELEIRGMLFLLILVLIR